MRKLRRWRKDYPYYKVQVFDDHIASWKDERKIFDTVEEAQQHIARKISPRTSRIVVVEKAGRHPLQS
jgi:precorrin-4 methylase